MFDKNGHASGLAQAVAAPTHLVILSKNRPEGYVVTPVKGFENASVLRAGYFAVRAPSLHRRLKAIYPIAATQ